MVLQRGGFSLFVPLKLRYAAQVNDSLARLLEPHISLGKCRALCDREFRSESEPGFSLGAKVNGYQSSFLFK